MPREAAKRRTSDKLCIASLEGGSALESIAAELEIARDAGLLDDLNFGILDFHITDLRQHFDRVIVALRNSML